MRSTRMPDSIVMLCVATLAVTGVASAAADTTEPGQATATTAAVPVPPARHQTADLAPVALIIAQGGLGDAAYNDLAFSGLERGAETLGLEAQPVESDDIVAEGEQVLRRAGDAGFGLIIDLEFSHSEYFPTVAADYPDTLWSFFNLPIEGDNIRSVVFKEHEGSFLAGALAAMMTSVEDNDKINPEKVIGVIGGTVSEGIDKFISGYIEGANAVDPEVEVLVSLHQRLRRPDDRAHRGRGDVRPGCRHHLPGCGRRRPRRVRGGREANHYAIGVDSDQDSLEPGYILTSMVKRADVAVEQLMTEYADGTFEGGTVLELGLAEDGVGLSEFTETRDEIPEEFLAQIDEFRQQIIDGDLEVWDVVEQGYPDWLEG